MAGFLFALGLPALAVNGYLGLLGLLARKGVDEPDKVDALPRFPHMTFVVPAHNEASGIERTIRSLRAVDYPADKFDVLVVADNCTDNTKELAQASGARVVERNDLNLRGKGYALHFAFQILLSEGKTEALVVVDADTDISQNLLRAMAKRLSVGEMAMQAHYGVRNVDDSWRTALMDLAFTLYHGVRSSARERLGLSAGLRGNGMGFAAETLRRVPHHAHSLVEDVEYGIQLGLNGIRVAYVAEAEVRGEMVAKTKASESQRQRWEQGRDKMLRNYLPTLLARALRDRNGILLDLGLDLLTPPLATVCMYTGAGMATALLVVFLGFGEPIIIVPWAASVAALSVYLARGIQISSNAPKALLALTHAPKYALWKLRLRLGKNSGETRDWVRTRRAGD